MSEKTGIAWTDHTFNPWWGCVRVSPGCEHCYAERDSKRYGFSLWGPTTERRFFTDKHWNEPRKWDRDAIKTLGRPARVFCASMADVFEDRRDLDGSRARLFALIEETPNLRWQLLTKRPENALRLVPESWAAAWPRNVWFGVTAENQEWADKRVPKMLDVPAAVRFISYEPALGPLRLGSSCLRVSDPEWTDRTIDWVIVGGESGHTARTFEPEWASAVVSQCRKIEPAVPVFFKQFGSHPSGLSLRHRHGADPSEWPAGDWPREFPETGGLSDRL